MKRIINFLCPVLLALFSVSCAVCALVFSAVWKGESRNADFNGVIKGEYETFFARDRAILPADSDVALPPLLADGASLSPSVDMTSTKYMVSQPSEDGKYYMLLVTAFDLDAAAEQNACLIGYKIRKDGGEEYEILDNKYYTGIISSANSYTAADIFGQQYADYALIVCEIEDYDPKSAYTYQAIILSAEEEEYFEIAQSSIKLSSVRYTLTIDMNGERINALISGTVSVSSLENLVSNTISEGDVCGGIYADGWLSEKLFDKITVTADLTVYANVYPATEGTNDWITQITCFEGAEVAKNFNCDSNDTISDVSYILDGVSFVSSQALQISVAQDNPIIRYDLSQPVDMTGKSYTVDYKGEFTVLTLEFITSQDKRFRFEVYAAQGTTLYVYDTDKNDGYFYGNAENTGATGASYGNAYCEIPSETFALPNGWKRFSINGFNYSDDILGSISFADVSAVIIQTDSVSGSVICFDNMYFAERSPAATVTGTSATGNELIWTADSDMFAYKVYLDGKLFATTYDNCVNLADCSVGRHEIYVTGLPKNAEYAESNASEVAVINIIDKGDFVTSTFYSNLENCSVTGNAISGFAVTTEFYSSYCALRFPGEDYYYGMFNGKILELSFKINPSNPLISLSINTEGAPCPDITLTDGGNVSGITVTYNDNNCEYTLLVDADVYFAALGISGYDISYLSIKLNGAYSGAEIATFTGAYCYCAVQ